MAAISQTIFLNTFLGIKVVFCTPMDTNASWIVYKKTILMYADVFKNVLCKIAVIWPTS